MKIDNRQVRILLVDDNPVNMEIAGKTLEKEEYDLYIADNGFTALELLDKIDMDLILMDIMMPEMDGFEAFKIIRNKKRYQDVPVIFVTAKADIDSVCRGFDLGAVDYIRMPFNVLELWARVRTHIELKKAREELEEKNRSLQDAYERLEIIATTDSLTKLLNRREMIRRIEYERTCFERNKRPFSIIMADIDFFKQINDTYGHNYGDYILSAIADILKSSARKQDSIARWGGEEFLMLLPGTDAKGAAVLAEKLRGKIESTTFMYENICTNVTMTFGINEYAEEQNLDALIYKADSALYEGKQSGRNRVVLYQQQIEEPLQVKEG